MMEHTGVRYVILVVHNLDFIVEIYVVPMYNSGIFMLLSTVVRENSMRPDFVTFFIHYQYVH